MKNIILILILITSKVSFSQHAADNADFTRKAGAITNIMVQKLSLTDQQKELVNQINLTFFERLQSILQSPDTASLKKQQIVLLNKGRVDSLQKVFTPTQFKRYQDDMVELEKKSREKMDENKMKQKMLALKQDSVNRSRLNQPRTSN